MSDASLFTFEWAYIQASLCLVAYDTLLTLSREVECIWKRKFSMVTALFVLQRWVLVLDGMLNNLPATHLWECAYHPSIMCKTQLIVDAVFIVLTFLGTGAFSTCRIWAIWGHALGPTLIVALTSAVVPAINLMNSRSGTVYFGIALVLNIATLILDLIQPLRNNITTLTNASLVSHPSVGANLLARFMLDLRSVNEQGSSKPRTMSSINFNIQSLSENIGAPLGIEDSTWVTGPADDVANERDKQYEEATLPFRAGLGLEIEEVPLDSLTSAGCEASSSRINKSADTASDGELQEAPRKKSTAADIV
ncbi:hypothetical protein EIP91_003886 [Steccherinum ochraceum]|uniref:DUF6533 domain-containing protein n=1 Tax=Steccherinum ochraceum TaxID=92696 RepID=A0A4R0R9R4_9APHY|nr:hypothetical protein EIP91_003886 [Steccherinum ochraceum]